MLCVFRRQDAASRPKREFQPKTVHDLQLNLDVNDGQSDHSRETLNGGPPPPYFPTANIPSVKGMRIVAFFV